MNTLTKEHVRDWMETYGRAGAENDPRASASLFARDAAYYETPFDEPMVGRDAIYAYWNLGAQNLCDKEATFEILAVNGNLGVVRWQSQFTFVASGQRLALDCLFVVEFNADGLCRTFREWWHIQEINHEHCGA